FSNRTYYVSFLSYFFYCYADHRDLHSFPTRRSSDLDRRQRQSEASEIPDLVIRQRYRGRRKARIARDFHVLVVEVDVEYVEITRSEEHTSELQSLRHLVCRLLLEKKK